MRRVDLHDDTLLDSARRGTLSDSQRARLITHCRSCAACALELGWIEDGLHARVPLAGDRARGLAAVDAVLGVGMSAQVEARAASVSRAAPRSGRMSVRRAAALAFLGLFISSAAAAFFTGAAQRAQTRWLMALAPEVVAAPVVKKSRRAHAKTVAQAAPMLGAQAVPARVEAPAAFAPVVAVTAEPVLPPSAAAHERAGVISPDVMQAQAERLFAAANEARAAGAYESALAGYAHLSRHYRGTRAELMSRVSRGNLWLAQAPDPGRARDAFASYLAARPHGTLAEESLAGLARAYAQLGRGDDEKAVWEALLEQHPGSLHAAYASARIAALSH